MVAAITVTLAALCPAGVSACEPIVPLTMLYMGPTLNGFAFGIALVGVAVIVKTFIFLLNEGWRRIPASFLAVILANALTTIAGAAAALIFTIPQPMMLVPAIVVFFMSAAPARRFLENVSLPPVLQWVRRGFMGWLFMLWVASIVFFGLASGALQDWEFDAPGSSVQIYWALKLAYIFLAVFVSMTFTTFWEEWIVAATLGFWENSPSNKTYYTAIFRGNAATFLLIWGVLALRMLPERLRSPGYLVMLFKDLLA